MMEEHQSYEEILSGLKDPSKKRDPRSIRVAAVTSALLEVVGDDWSAAKVYASTVTALEGTLQPKQETPLSETLSTQVALLELLHVTLPHVTPPAIVSATLPLTSRVLRAVVTSSQSLASEIAMETKDELGGVNAVLRGACRASVQVLKRLDSKTDEKAVKQLFLSTLVTLFEDRRPKVRKAAQNGTIELLMMEDPYKCHPIIVKSASAYAHSQLRKALKDRSNETLAELLHLLSFLERSILYLDYSKLGVDVMELLVALFQIEGTSSTTDFVAVVKVKEATPRILTISALLSTILSMLAENSLDKNDTLDEFAPRVLASLLQAKPSLIFRGGSADFDILQRGRTLFGQVILAACQRVLATKPDIGAKLFPLSIQVLLALSRPDEEVDGDTSVAQTLMVELTQLFRTHLAALKQSNTQDVQKCLEDSLQNMQHVMQPRYRATWSVSLKGLVVLLQVLQESPQVPECVDLLLGLRNDVPAGSPSQRAVEDAVSTFIQGVGVEAIWKWVRWHPVGPVSKKGSNDSAGISIDRAWILSTMKTASVAAQPQQPKLAFFQTEVLGMARVCDRLAAARSKERLFFQARVVDLWGLFPCFCKAPSDLQLVLPSLTATLGKALEDRRYPALVTIICSGLTSLVSSISEEENLEAEDADRGVLEASAVQLLPILFRIATSTGQAANGGDMMDVDEKSKASIDQGQRIQSVSEAVTSLSRVAPKEFLSGLFKKLMHRLLEEVQSDSSDSERLCSLLSLSQALVASDVLDEASVSFLYRALKTLIRNDQHGSRVQKRAYKVLAEICERHHSFVADLERLKELTSLLTSTIMTSQVAARHMRLKCMNIILDGLDESNSIQMSAILKVVPEILLCLKDANAKTREASYQLLIALANKEDLKNFLEVVTAALGAETPHMRSAAVMALSRIVYEFAWDDLALQELLPSLLSTVLVLIDENSREVIKSVIGFIRINVAAIPADRLEPLLPELIGGLLKYHKAKSRFRAKIKIILKKLVKQFGYDALMPFVPESETRLLTHMRKLDERQARRKAEQRAEGRQPDTFDDMLESDEEDSDDGRTLMTGATGFTRLTGRIESHAKTVGGKSIASRASKSHAAAATTIGISARSKNASIRLPNEADGEVVDILGSKMAKRVHFANDEMDDSDSDDDAMEFDNEGRLFIHDKSGVEEPERVDDDDVMERAGKKRRLSKLESAKARREDDKKKKHGKHVRELGAAYKSKKAGGDVKKKGQKYEPYAFVPLDGKSYSKKNRRTTVVQMSSVVKKGKRKRN